MEETRSELIRNDEPVNSKVNHNVKPPRPETTSHYYRMQVYKARQTQSNIDLEGFLG